MTDLLKYFDKVYVISMPDRPDRRVSLLDNLRSYGITEDFISENFECIFPTKRIGEHPARGCFASHALICADALSKGFKKILVLEDDASFITNSPEGIVRQLQLCEWDLLYLGGNPGSDLKRIDINLVEIKDTLCTHAIAYSAKSMEYVINSFKKFTEVFYPIDQVLKSAQGSELIAIGVNPMMATQTSGMSDIEKHPVDYWFIVDNYRRYTTHAADESKHSKVKVGFFINMKKEDMPALRFTASSLSKQKYSNFELIIVSDEPFDLDGISATLYVGTLEDAMKSSSCHVCCELRCGLTVHPGVCFTVVQDYRMCSDSASECSDLVFSYDKKPRTSGRIIPWVYDNTHA